MRRGGGDKLHSKNQNKRKNYEKKNKRLAIIIACEDSVSSPTYFREILNNLIKERKIVQNSFVIVDNDGYTNPTGVLKKLKEYKFRKNTYKDFDHKWIVIDRDSERVNGGGHTKEDFNNALINAKNKKSENNINVAYSNDSFELWYLLHFDYLQTPITRDEIIVRLISKLKKRNSEGFKNLNKKNIKNIQYTKLIYTELLPLRDTAIKNAEKLLKSYGVNHNPESDNPSTTVNKLVRILKDIE